MSELDLTFLLYQKHVDPLCEFACAFSERCFKCYDSFLWGVTPLGNNHVRLYASTRRFTVPKKTYQDILCRFRLNCSGDKTQMIVAHIWVHQLEAGRGRPFHRRRVQFEERLGERTSMQVRSGAKKPNAYSVTTVLAPVSGSMSSFPKTTKVFQEDYSDDIAKIISGLFNL